MSAHLSPPRRAVPLRPDLQTWSWQMSGACRDADAELFFPPEHLPRAERGAREQAAKQVCAQCPVRPDCLAHAVRVGERFGVWGGQSPAERAVAASAGPVG